MSYPDIRLRRLRKNGNFRRMIRETALSVDDLVMPLFVCPGSGVKREISSMPGNYNYSIDNLVEACKEIESLGILGVILFGIPEKKNPLGTEGYAEKGIIQEALRAVKSTTKNLLVITDVCLCEYTDHGHCGALDGQEIDNDRTLELLCRMAASHAKAGADMVAPSDMMDGRIGAIREALDMDGFSNLPIMAYSAKYASAFYGPFRDAADSAPAFGHRRSYQMDPANSDEAMREIELDIAEGADIVMVKPALPYLDIIRRAADNFTVPIAAYNVSGEFAMIKAAAQNGWLDGDRVMMESLLSIKRAGARIILTYFAIEAAKLLD